MTKISDPIAYMLGMTWDSGDAWAWCLGWHFAIAETLWIAGEEVPAHWEFHPGITFYGPVEKSIS